MLQGDDMHAAQCKLAFEREAALFGACTSTALEDYVEGHFGDASTLLALERWATAYDSCSVEMDLAATYTEESGFACPTFDIAYLHVHMHIDPATLQQTTPVHDPGHSHGEPWVEEPWVEEPLPVDDHDHFDEHDHDDEHHAEHEHDHEDEPVNEEESVNNGIIFPDGGLAGGIPSLSGFWVRVEDKMPITVNPSDIPNGYCEHSWYDNNSVTEGSTDAFNAEGVEMLDTFRLKLDNDGDL
jgi:hypothetical protein